MCCGGQACCGGVAAWRQSRMKLRPKMRHISSYARITQESTKLRRIHATQNLRSHYAEITQFLCRHYAEFTQPLRRFYAVITQILHSLTQSLRNHYAGITQSLRDNYAAVTQSLRRCNHYEKFKFFLYAHAIQLRRITQFITQFLLCNYITQLFYAIVLRRNSGNYA